MKLDIIKIDMALTRAINTDPIRFEIARAVIELCARLHISVIAEGIETLDEAISLRALGIRLFQGYLFAKPAIERLPVVDASGVGAIIAAHETRLIGGNSDERAAVSK